MIKGTVVGELRDGRPIVELGCGCQYADSFAPLSACYDHRYIHCAKCGGWAEITPFGMMCTHCTFGNAIMTERPPREA